MRVLERREYFEGLSARSSTRVVVLQGAEKRAPNDLGR